MLKLYECWHVCFSTAGPLWGEPSGDCWRLTIPIISISFRDPAKYPVSLAINISAGVLHTLSDDIPPVISKQLLSEWVNNDESDSVLWL